jgi:hypothetical protein
VWQLSWMLSFIPSGLWSFLLWGSLATFAATYFLTFIKPLAVYAHIIRPVALVIAFFSVYWIGGSDVEEKWQAKVKEMEAKVALAEEQSKTTNAKIETKVVTKTKVVKERGEAIVQYVDRVVTQDKEVIKFVEHCPIPTSIVNTINSAAKNQPIGEKK